MPNIDSAFSDLAGSTCYAIMKFFHGYSRLPLLPNSQECQSFIAPDGVKINAPDHFKFYSQGLCTDFRERVLQ